MLLRGLTWLVAFQLLGTVLNVLFLPMLPGPIIGMVLLFAGLLVVAAETRLPIALHELGASAGLNLNLDRFGYRYGEVMRGEPSSPVRLAPRWHGAPPPDATVTIARRIGNDIAPIDVTARSGRERLLAYAWPDQPERIARLEAALAIAAAHPPPIEPGDAAAFVERHFSAPPRPGETRVLSHSIALQYVAEAGRARIAACLRAASHFSTSRMVGGWEQVLTLGAAEYGRRHQTVGLAAGTPLPDGAAA